GHPAVPDAAAQLQHQLEGQFRLGAEDHPLRYAGGAAAVWVVGPLVGQVQPGVQQGMAAVAGVGGVDGDLAVGDLTQGAAVLAGDPDALGAGLGEAALVEDEDALGAAELVIDPSDEFAAQGGVVPGGLADEDLGHADLGGVGVDPKGDALGGL